MFAAPESFEELLQLEQAIGRHFRQFKLDEVLLGLRNHCGSFQPFSIAGTALVALKHCTARYPKKEMRVLGPDTIRPLTDLVTTYLLADPISFDRQLQKEYAAGNYAFLLLRLVGNQAPFAQETTGQFARAYMLYHEFPKKLAGVKGIPRFDLQAEFRRINGISVEDFITVAYALFAAASRNVGFTRGWFAKAREQGVQLPRDPVLDTALNRLCADADTLKSRALKTRQQDRRFGMYDPNPLFKYPVVRPWRSRDGGHPAQVRMIAPLPDLIGTRATTGVFYQLWRSEGFLDYFGHVFSEYVGHLLAHCTEAEAIFSERDIRRTYSSRRGKAPDWVVLDGNTAIVLECKATRFSRSAMVDGGQGAIDESLRQIGKGLGQLREFIDACKAKTSGLEAFASCTRFIPVVVTMEPMWLINSRPFQGYVGNRFPGTFGEKEWIPLYIDQLEALQPHLKHGCGVGRTFNQIMAKGFNEVITSVEAADGLRYGASILASWDNQLQKRLGVSDEDSQLLVESE